MSTNNNDKFLSIPPYISTSWKNIRSLRMEDTHLIVTLTDGSVVRVPNLDHQAIETVFASHATFLNTAEGAEETSQSSPFRPGRLPEGFPTGGFPFRIGPGGEGLAQAMQHDPSQAHAPDLPKEILQKVSAIAKILVPPDSDELPKAEPHCNCMHCQIARAIQAGADEEELEGIEEEVPSTLEEVSDDDLRFREWNIDSIGEEIYQVTNPFDSDESFKVCLHPVGCTCGEENCEHILAVLRS